MKKSSSEYPRYNSHTTWSSRRRKTEVSMFQIFLEAERKYSMEEIQYGAKLWRRDWRKGHSETAPPGYPSHIQSPNPDTFTDAKKCLLTGPEYSGLLRDSARAWQIQRQMLAVNHWTEHAVPNVGGRERIGGTEEICNPKGRTTISTTCQINLPIIITEFRVC